MGGFVLLHATLLLLSLASAVAIFPQLQQGEQQQAQGSEENLTPCTCLWTVYGDANCTNILSNTSLLHGRANSCQKFFSGEYQSYKIVDGCKVMKFYGDDDDCVGIHGTYQSDGQCNRIPHDHKKKWSRMLCTGGQPRKCICTTSWFKDSKCTQFQYNTSAEGLQDQCTKNGTTSFKLSFSCNQVHDYDTDNCTGSVTRTRPAISHCIKTFQGRSAITSCASSPDTPAPPQPPPSNGCSCTFLYWQNSLNCTDTTRHTIKTIGGQCTDVRLPFDGELGVEVDKKCEYFRAYPKATCSGSTISGVSQINTCATFNNGASGLVACG